VFVPDPAHRFGKLAPIVCIQDFRGVLQENHRSGKVFREVLVSTLNESKNLHSKTNEIEKILDRSKEDGPKLGLPGLTDSKQQTADSRQQLPDRRHQTADITAEQHSRQHSKRHSRQQVDPSLDALVQQEASHDTENGAGHERKTKPI
jgi:hypothetical protein